MVLNTANAVFWTAFGFGVLDWFIIVPNGLGAVLGFVQMVLRMVVPCRENEFGLSSTDGGGAASESKGDMELGEDTSASPSSPSVMVDDSN